MFPSARNVPERRQDNEAIWNPDSFECHTCSGGFHGLCKCVVGIGIGHDEQCELDCSEQHGSGANELDGRYGWHGDDAQLVCSRAGFWQHRRHIRSVHRSRLEADCRYCKCHRGHGQEWRRRHHQRRRRIRHQWHGNRLHHYRRCRQHREGATRSRWREHHQCRCTRNLRPIC